jgi:hypothetical protein
MNMQDEKTAFNAQAKAGMRDYLRSKSWEEKVESIRRMNAMSKMARAAMREALLEGESSVGAEV